MSGVGVSFEEPTTSEPPVQSVGPCVRYEYTATSVFPTLTWLNGGTVVVVGANVSPITLTPVAAAKSTARNNFLIAALWSETCLVFPALQMLEEGYGVYAVEDASGGTSKAAHDAAIRRIEQAGAVSLTALQVLLEFQRDWARKEHYEEVMAVVKEHCGAYGQGIEYAATMVQKAPASRNRQTSNTKM